MLIFGHRFIESKKFYYINSINSIKNTPPSSNILVEFNENNLDIINHLQINSINFALEVKNITEIMYASALGSSYILVKKSLAMVAQNLAQNYLFDSKILVHINNEDEIEEFALMGVDGIIFSSAIVKTYF
jgi:hypothetical protein